MLRSAKLVSVGALLLGAMACEPGRYSSAGFRLPANGNADRGRTAFVELKCHRCHDVAGAKLPVPLESAADRIPLGGEVERLLTDGYLVTSIIHPSHRIAPSRQHLLTAAQIRSPMPEYADNLSVQQLTDLVAFLQSSYSFVPPMSSPAF